MKTRRFYVSTFCLILNGHLSDSCVLQRGCRQGDPISPYLFILCSEFLTLALKNVRNLEGIIIKNKERECSQYADDTSIFLKASENNLRLCLSILSWFYHVSGLKINIKKTKVIRIGPIRETDRRFCRENDPEKVRYKVIGGKMKGMESSMKLVALGATQRKG